MVFIDIFQLHFYGIYRYWAFLELVQPANRPVILQVCSEPGPTEHSGNIPSTLEHTRSVAIYRHEIRGVKACASLFVCVEVLRPSQPNGVMCI